MDVGVCPTLGSAAVPEAVDAGVLHASARGDALATAGQSRRYDKKARRRRAF
jgi:hypothetical protein